ncbi:MAG: hypothetical protein ACE5K0_09565 [Candidatus Methanofastidiosia archaeon]
MNRMFVVLGFVLFILGGSMGVLIRAHRTIPYEIIETYTVQESFLEYQLVSREISETIQTPYLKEIETKKTVTEKVPYVYHYYGDPYYYYYYGYYYPYYPYYYYPYYPYYYWYYPYGVSFVGYKTVSKEVTDKDYVLDYREETISKTIYESIPVEKTREVTKQRPVVKFKREVDYWPQYFGGVVAFMGIALLAMSMFVEE